MKHRKPNTRARGNPQTIHKFYLGQTVVYYPDKGTWAARGAYVVTAKLPERNGEFEYRIGSAIEEHERLARESELREMSEADTAPAGSKARR